MNRSFNVFNLPIDTIIPGNTLSVLNTLPSESIDCVITSPPYWGLRSYSTTGQLWGGDSECEHEWLTGKEKVIRGTATRIEDSLNQATYKDIRLPPTDSCQLCNAWRGELGLEPTFQLYIEHLQTIFDEVYRVLKKTGTCWVNLGDSYAGSGKGYGGADHGKLGKHANEFLPAPIDTEIPTKSLCNIPHRFAISMTDSGWIQRNTIIWHKPSCMPSSAKDRFTVDFEYVFLFTKNKKYYFEQQFEAQAPHTLVAFKNGIRPDYPKRKNNPENIKEGKTVQGVNTPNAILPNGRNKRTVWRINPQPFKDAHFAVFPEKLVEPMIKAGCPSLVCDSCNKPWDSDLDISYTHRARHGKPEMGSYVGNQHKKITDKKVMANGRENDYRMDKHTKVLSVTPRCDCDAPTRAGIVLDPFVGSGTTALVARKLNRHYIGIDLNEDYVTMANKRLSEVL